MKSLWFSIPCTLSIILILNFCGYKTTILEAALIGFVSGAVTSAILD